ncbi:hypothetical protein TNIN_242701 [Trichonephila inaurata madagascariensis]|uniref:Uncharacterized protein n=1 Tax=Trichonephila inaurata madagascariensis TaxID=2747483 RepID=A0A8X6XN65_9ARAC|nr:hypothetical protein TNIN_242701 [Trichonephila inaurata madagascariensis]
MNRSWKLTPFPVKCKTTACEISNLLKQGVLIPILRYGEECSAYRLCRHGYWKHRKVSFTRPVATQRVEIMIGKGRRGRSLFKSEINSLPVAVLVKGKLPKLLRALFGSAL